MKIIIATVKDWNLEAAALWAAQNPQHETVILSEPAALSVESVIERAPDIIFLVHWNWLLPAEITERFTCVVFHMTDLPYGRGGSPLQNLIVRGHEQTKISAIRANDGIDSGPVYLKEELSLSGSAEDIFKRAAEIIFTRMIPRILQQDYVLSEQTGTPTYFRRRKPEESVLSGDMTLKQVYDTIRMLDAEGYPPAEIQLGNLRITFKRAVSETNRVSAEAVFTVLEGRES